MLKFPMINNNRFFCFRTLSIFDFIKYLLFSPVIYICSLLLWLKEGVNNKYLVFPVILMALISFSFSKKEFIKENLNSIFLWVIIIFSSWVIVIDLSLGYSSAAIRGFLISIVLSIFFPKNLLTDKLWSLLSFIGSMGLFIWLIYQGELLHLGRGQWHINAIPLATLSGAIFLINFMIFSFSKEKITKLFSLLSVIFSFGVIIYAQTRGVWLALFFSGLIMLYRHRDFFTPKRWAIFLILNCAILSACSPYLIERLKQTKNEHVAIVEHNNLNTSVGLRFQMWDAAIKLLPEAGMIGLGDDHKIKLHELYDRNEVSSGLIDFSPTHYHNQFLTVWVISGFVGFVLFIVFLFVSLFEVRKGNSPYKDGLISLVVLYAISGMTDVPFFHASTIIFFIFLSQILIYKHNKFI